MKILKLDNVLASRIAAGEVVENPASVLRELLDNAIDAKATKITVVLKEGGIKTVQVSDNGEGIAEEDLPLAFESHATSKIKTMDDLYNISSLGFRGEALCSIAACSKLTLASGGKSLTVDNGSFSAIKASAISEGTTVTSENIFEKIPARMQFLRRANSEYSECRKIFTEKALGFEKIEFILINEDKTDLHFMPETKFQRVRDVLALNKDFIASEVFETSAEDDSLQLFAVASTPKQYRHDRGQIKIFVNNRIVDNYAMVKVIANAYSMAIPGGVFPYFYLFVQDSPELVDFNIHPAKRECKIRNQSFIFSLLTSMIRTSLIRENKKTETVAYNTKTLFTENTDNNEKNVSEETDKQQRPEPQPIRYQQFVSKKNMECKSPEVTFNKDWFDKAKKILKNPEIGHTAEKDRNESCKPGNKTYRYIGQVFNTFLVAEQDDKVLFIDQHAAHERLLYNEITDNKDIQALAIPYRFETDRTTDDFLEKYSFIYADLGITLVRSEPMLWEIVSVPAQCRKNEEKLANYIKTAIGDTEEVKKGLFAVIACHAAIKAGEELDSISAKNLVDKIFELDEFICPHGRSFVYSVSKTQLFKEVGRII